jgi:hypothetical protein
VYDTSSCDKHVYVAKLVRNLTERSFNSLLVADIESDSDSFDLVGSCFSVLDHLLDEIGRGLLGELLIEVKDYDRVGTGFGKCACEEVA